MTEESGLERSNISNQGGEKIDNKRPKQTIKSLDSKIEEANNFLQILNEKIEQRDEEIRKLKSVISSERSKADDTGSKLLYNAVIVDDKSEESDLEGEDVALDLQVAVKPAEEEEFSEIEEDQPNRYKNRKRKRSRSRSRGRSNGKNYHDDNEHDNLFRTQTGDKEVGNFEQRYQSDPQVQNLVKKMVEEQVEREMKKIKMNTTNKTGLKEKIMKSPSDSATIYVPAIKRMDQNITHLSGSPNLNRIINAEQINDGLTNLRLIAERRVDQPQPGTSSSAGAAAEQDPDMMRKKQARSAAENAILDAERFKAQIQPPNRGRLSEVHCNNEEVSRSNQSNPKQFAQIQFNNGSPPCMNELEQLRHMRYLDCEDDEFFHTTCHIDAVLKEKISKGQFVELEKLLQKKLQSGQQEGRLQLINKDGASFFVPPIDRDTKIDSIKKWEQAFRAYTTIYCKSNPHRAGEILQYADVIHRAASIFSWDNVAKYDYVFRQLMAEKPHRSWAKVYTQMWNITLNEPIRKFNDNGNNNKQGSQGRKKDSYCWKFNKNSCNYGKNCKFEHKCSYCGAYNHSFQNCLKRQGKKNERNDKQEKQNK